MPFHRPGASPRHTALATPYFSAMVLTAILAPSSVSTSPTRFHFFTAVQTSILQFTIGTTPGGSDGRQNNAASHQGVGAAARGGVIAV